MPEQKSDHTLSGDFDGPVTAGGGDAVDMRDSQGPIYKPVGDVKQHFGPALYLPLVGVALLAIALVIAAMVFNIGPLTALLPTPMPFEPAAEGESLIIVADFEDRSAGKYQGVDPAQYVYEQLRTQVNINDLQIRVERLRQVVDDNTAKSIGDTYNASLVVWGWYDRIGILPRIEQLGYTNLRYSSGNYQLQQLGQPETVAFRKIIAEELPTQSTYLVVYALGVEKYFSGNMKEALGFFSTALEVDPKRAEAYNNRGWTYHVMGEYDKALEDYNCAIDLDPTYAWPYNNRGVTHHEMGNYEKALLDFGQAIEMEPNFVWPYNNRGLTYHVLGEYEKALTDYDHALRINPEFAWAYNNLGWTYHNMGNYAEALQNYDRAVEIDPEFVWAYNNRGLLHHALGEYRQALSDYADALQLDPEFGWAYNNRGWTYTAMGKYEKALKDYSDALDFDSDFPWFVWTYNNRGRTYQEMGEHEKALAEYNRALGLEPDFPNALYGRGQIFYQLGYVEPAVTDFERFLALSEDKTLCKEAEQYLEQLKEKKP